MSTTTRLTTGLAVLAAVATLSAAPASAARSPQGADHPAGVVQDQSLALWYLVYNPSINKPRGAQDAPDGWTRPTQLP